MRLIDLTCPQCGAKLQVNEELTKCTCNFCGNTILVDDEKKEVKITGGYEFGYGEKYGQLQAEHDFKQQHPSEESILLEQQKKEFNKQIKLYSLKRAWSYGTIAGLLGFFCILLTSAPFKWALTIGLMLCVCTFIFFYILFVKIYKK